MAPATMSIQSSSKERRQRPGPTTGKRRRFYSAATKVALILCAQSLLFLSSSMLVEADTIETPENYTLGEPSCPCLSAEEVADLDPADINVDVLGYFPGDPSRLATYGIGCGAHDMGSRNCNARDCAEEVNLIPPRLDCDLSYCHLNFCYVDPNRCDLLNRRSALFPNTYRFFSYATCWDVDSFTSTARIASLEDRVFKVGFNSNSGGWQGAYSEAKEQFKGPPELWSGPTVDFALLGAKEGKYRLNLTEPPEFLRSRAEAYFSSQSNFDFCVFATSLGYLDFCLAQYTITDQRAATTDWLVLSSQQLHLIVQYQQVNTPWEQFLESCGTIFLPFTTSVWIFMVLFVIPVLGALMIIHEYNHPGSAYPKSEDVLVKDNTRPGSVEQVEHRTVPTYRHVSRSIYINLLSVLQQNYVHSVVSNGALLNLLGISFFILTIIAVYTANLAAILTQKAQDTAVSGINDAIRANFRICSERKNLETVRELPNELIVVDPVLEGGDGLPGFNCPTCAARTRVFDFLDMAKAESGDARYCHAAFAPLEDLDVEQKLGRHCNKTSVGAAVGSTQTGFPVNEKVSPELVSWFLKLKNDGVWDREIKEDRPQPTCPEFDAGGEEGESLNISQLTGIWVVSFGFAAAGLLVTCLQPKIDACRPRTIKPVHAYDQMGQRVNVLEKDDQWIDEKSILKGTKRIYLGDSRWSKAAAKIGGGSTMGSQAFTVMSKRGASRTLNLEGLLDDDDMIISNNQRDITPGPMSASSLQPMPPLPSAFPESRFQRSDKRLPDFPSMARGSHAMASSSRSVGSRRASASLESLQEMDDEEEERLEFSERNGTAPTDTAVSSIDEEIEFLQDLALEEERKGEDPPRNSLRRRTIPSGDEDASEDQNVYDA